jgi:DASS family divalent anion:Na+ symporter
MFHQIKGKLSLILTLALGVSLWNLPHSDKLTPEAWHLFALFMTMIFGIIVRAMPMGAIAIVGLSVAVLTKTLKLGEALSGFSDEVTWLILLSFFIARGFIKTGLGNRIAYHFIKRFGKTTLGLAYSAIFSEFALSPATPSQTARCGGVVYPIVNSIARVLGSEPNSKSSGDVGTFLTLTTIHGSVICSAMFVTGIASNPLIIDIIRSITGIEVSWLDWAKAAIVPGALSLVLIPLIIYFISPPKIKKVPGAIAFAEDKLKKMGPASLNECILFSVFLLLIILWIAGKYLGINSVATAFLGISLLLITSVLTFSDIVDEKGAWDTFIWFSVLLMLASFLSKFGVIGYYSEIASQKVKGFSWPVAFLILTVLYYYSHYIFAGAVAHVTAMYGAFLSIAILVGVPPMLAALSLAFFSSLFGALTHYGSGPGPVLFGTGYATIKQWWGVGAVISVAHLIIWLGIGSVWWKFLGFW